MQNRTGARGIGPFFSVVTHDDLRVWIDAQAADLFFQIDDDCIAVNALAHSSTSTQMAHLQYAGLHRNSGHERPAPASGRRRGSGYVGRLDEQFGGVGGLRSPRYWVPRWQRSAANNQATGEWCNSFRVTAIPSRSGLSVLQLGFAILRAGCPDVRRPVGPRKRPAHTATTIAPMDRAGCRGFCLFFEFIVPPRSIPAKMLGNNCDPYFSQPTGCRDSPSNAAREDAPKLPACRRAAPLRHSARRSCLPLSIMNSPCCGMSSQ